MGNETAIAQMFKKNIFRILATVAVLTVGASHGDDSDNPAFIISNPNSPWYGKRLFDLYAEAAMPWDWHKPIMDRAKQVGVKCFSSPFDSESLEFLLRLDVPFIKIASHECIDIPLISKAAASGKPLIISTGMATISEIFDAVNTARSHGCQSLTLLKCTTSYPASPTDCNILTIPHMRDLFQCEVGLSDHTLGIGTAIAAVAHGASFVEKHFTLDRSLGGPDSTFSLEPAEFQRLVQETTAAKASLGTINYNPTESEIASRSKRRSLYAIDNIKAGEIFNESNVKSLRPSGGLEPKFFDSLLGRICYVDLPKGSPILWEHITP